MNIPKDLIDLIGKAFKLSGFSGTENPYFLALLLQEAQIDRNSELYSTIKHLISSEDSLSSCKLPKANSCLGPLTSAIKTLGELNIILAAELMSDRLKQLALVFKLAEAEDCFETQAEVLEKVFDELCFRNNFADTYEDNLLADFHNQPYTRVFPKLFAAPDNFKPGQESFQPNCLGKAILIAGFCELAGAECLGLTPIIFSEDAVSSVLKEIGKEIEIHADACGLELSQLFKDAIHLRGSLAVAKKDMLDRAHFVNLIRLSNKTYWMVDPHQRIFGRCYDRGKIESKFRFVQEFSGNMPGIVVSYFENQSTKQVVAPVKVQLKALEEARRYLNIAAFLNRDSEKLGDGESSVPALLAQKGIAEILVEKGRLFERDRRSRYLKMLAGEENYQISTKCGSMTEFVPVPDFSELYGGEEGMSIEDWSRLQVVSTICVEVSGDLLLPANSTERNLLKIL